MLEQLSSINWSDLTHAYGPADDVPQLLRDLASPDEEVRGRALGTLYTSIYHQGTVYQASAYAAPFLIELIEQEQVSNRDGILRLLADLAGGDAYHRQHLSFYDKERTQDPAFQQAMAEEVLWVEKTADAVAAGIPTYLRLLDHQEVKLRMSAARVIGSFPREAAHLVPLLRGRFHQERDQRVRACLLFSVGVLLARLQAENTQGWRMLETALETGEAGLERTAAAMALMGTHRASLPARALDVVLDAIVSAEPRTDLYEELPWAESRLPYDAIRCLYALPRDQQARVLPRLISLLGSLTLPDAPGAQTLAAYIAGDLAPVLIAFAFGERRETERSQDELTDHQRAVLTALVQSDAVWKWHVGQGYVQHTSAPGGGGQVDGTALFKIVVQTKIHELLLHGLPDSRAALRAFLGLEPQETDTLHFVSREQHARWTPPERKQAVLAELIRYNPGSSLADLKMLVGDYEP